MTHYKKSISNACPAFSKRKLTICILH
uniref:Uncharacterized protein n=1 Tax=Anguilla anguilla TaxID=7936 RepID=A0A0E9V7W3_ANGAN